MRAIWKVLCCSCQYTGGYGNISRNLITVLYEVNLRNNETGLFSEYYRMVWAGWAPNLMNTGPPVWLTIIGR